MKIFLNIDPLLLQQYTTIATVFIAVLALFLSIWHLSVQRKHNKLSVKPLLTFEELTANTERGFGVFVRNDGIGPAIIKEFKIYVDNIQIISDYKHLWKEAAKKLSIDYNFVMFHTFEPKTSINTGLRLPVFTIEQKVNKEQTALFKKSISRLNIEILYESIYGQKDRSLLNES